jgi:hypothetical protein
VMWQHQEMTRGIGSHQHLTWHTEDDVAQMTWRLYDDVAQVTWPVTERTVLTCGLIGK